MIKDKEFNRRKTKMIKRGSLKNICDIYTWDYENNKYTKRSSGMRFYAYVKINKHQFSRCFHNLRNCKNWIATLKSKG